MPGNAVHEDSLELDRPQAVLALLNITNARTFILAAKEEKTTRWLLDIKEVEEEDNSGWNGFLHQFSKLSLSLRSATWKSLCIHPDEVQCYKSSIVDSFNRSTYHS